MVGEVRLEWKGMSETRYHELMDGSEGLLTVEEVNAGWHFCADWDFLLIHEDNPEAESCSCGGIPK